MAIREFTQEDLPQIFDIYANSKLDELRFEEETCSLLPLEQDSKRLNELLESDIYVLDNGQCIQGYAALYDREIRALFVHPKFRGMGVGKILLKFLLSKVSSPVCLNVARSNHPAIDMYYSYGFRVADTFNTFYNQLPVAVHRMMLEE